MRQDEDFPEEEVTEETEGTEEIPYALMTREEFLASSFENNDPIEDIRWVFQALGAEGLEIGDAPSPGAFYMLQQARVDELSAKAFYTLFAKVLPSKAEIEKGDNRAKDGSKFFDLIDGLLRESSTDAPVLSGTERRARELAISRQSA
jgi:hypothetical protein